MSQTRKVKYDIKMDRNLNCVKQIRTVRWRDFWWRWWTFRFI